MFSLTGKSTRRADNAAEQLARTINRIEDSLEARDTSHSQPDDTIGETEQLEHSEEDGSVSTPIVEEATAVAPAAVEGTAVVRAPVEEEETQAVPTVPMPKRPAPIPTQVRRAPAAPMRPRRPATTTTGDRKPAQGSAVEERLRNIMRVSALPPESSARP